MESALSDGILSISYTEWANEEARHKELKDINVEWGKTTTKGKEGGRRGYVH